MLVDDYGGVLEGGAGFCLMTQRRMINCGVRRLLLRPIIGDPRKPHQAAATPRNRDDVEWDDS